MSAPDLGDHVARRPLWLCDRCGDLWPCTPARRRLVAAFAGAPTSLTLYMHSQWVKASGDLYGSDRGVDVLVDRFVGWLPR